MKQGMVMAVVLAATCFVSPVIGQTYDRKFDRYEYPRCLFGPFFEPKCVEARLAQHYDASDRHASDRHTVASALECENTDKPEELGPRLCA